MILTPGVLLYHASYTAVENIDLSLCADGKDFGKGFYVTTDYNQAYKFVKTSILKAVKNGIKIENKTVGYISIYEFKQNQDLSIFEFAEADKQWLHCVAKHRKNTLLDNFSYNWNVYDIIVGKIANDTTNQVLTAYINGLYGEVGSDLADETAVRLLLPNKLANQLCFKSAKSLTSLVFKESREVWINEGKQI
ncbi:MAG: DUF3990 domain-containing protein [Treponema sp.]|nr:DUF3990 domain-containing protein [Treponema sp.]